MPTEEVVALAFLSFAFLHSLTVSRVFKKFASGIIGETRMRAYYRLAFTVFSAFITAAAGYVIWAQPDVVYYRPPWYLLYAGRAVQLAGVVIFVLAFRPFDAASFLGIRQAVDYTRSGAASGDIEGIRQDGLVATGAYGLVRHPMYLAGILVFLFEPVITVNNLVLRALAGAYFVFGMLVEERRFLKDYGDSYRKYQRDVPMFNVVSGIIRKLARR